VLQKSRFKLPDSAKGHPGKSGMLYFGGVAEGEGIAGRAGIGIGTTTLYGCLALTFLTRDFSFGGLYHYPASGVLESPVQATIRRMINDIGPTIVIITPAHEDRPGAAKSDRADLNRVREFVKLVWPAVEVGVAEPAEAASLHWRSGKPQINAAVPDDAKLRSPPKSIRNMHHPVGRELLGGAAYYGGRMSAKVAVRADE
jgi:hypothetical protein